MEKFNEGMLLLVYLSLPAFTQFVHSQEEQYQFGWYVVGLMKATIILNTLICLWLQIVEVFSMLKKFVTWSKAKLYPPTD